MALERAKEICQIVYDAYDSQGGVKAVEEQKQNVIVRDESGNIQLPVKVTNSLRVNNFGIVRSADGYHSKTNFFPVGWESV